MGIRGAYARVFGLACANRNLWSIERTIDVTDNVCGHANRLTQEGKDREGADTWLRSFIILLTLSRYFNSHVR